MNSATMWLDATILGLVQGLTEFLPISSSAHLRILGPLLPSGGDPGAAFTAITQIGTETAVLLYFRRDILRILRAWLAAKGVEILESGARYGAEGQGTSLYIRDPEGTVVELKSPGDDPDLTPPG